MKWAMWGLARSTPVFDQSWAPSIPLRSCGNAGLVLVVHHSLRGTRGTFPGGPVKNALANSGDMGSSPGPGRSHMPWGN